MVDHEKIVEMWLEDFDEVQDSRLHHEALPSLAITKALFNPEKCRNEDVNDQSVYSTQEIGIPCPADIHNATDVHHNNTSHHD